MAENPAGGLTAVFFFRFSAARHRWWAFKQMRLGHASLRQDPRISFYRILGCGGGSGFSLRPDFGTYCLLITAENSEALENFKQDNALYREYVQRSATQLQINLRCINTHGSWNGQAPFVEQEGGQDMILVLTRASIKPARMWEFWKQVPRVSRSLKKADGLLFARGVGEWPLIEQATISLWRSPGAMEKFAYGNRQHRGAMRETRLRNWYTEELFARFEVLAVEGQWPGVELPAGADLSATAFGS